MRQFNKVIFLGGGREVLADCYNLHRRLEEALTILGGIQQPDHSSNKEEYTKSKYARRRAKRELDDCIDDIVTALGRQMPEEVEEIDESTEYKEIKNEKI